MSKDTIEKSVPKRAPKKSVDAVEEAVSIESPINDLPYPDVKEQIDAATSFLEDWQASVKSLFSDASSGFADFQSGFADLKLAGDEVSRVVETSRIAAANGFAEASQVAQTFAKKAFDQNLALTKALLGAHSLPEALEIQHRYVQESLKGWADHFQELHAIGIDISQKTLEPVSESVSKSLSKVWTEKAA